MILILTQCFPPDAGGIEGLMGGLANALADAGEQVTVLADRIRGGDAECAFAYPVKRFGGPRPWRRWCKLRAARRLTARAIIADSWKSIEHLPPQRVPVLVLAHGMEFPHHASEKKRARIRAALAKASVVIANSHYTAGLVQPYIALEKLQVIHPPIAPQPEPTEAALAKLDALIVGRTPLIASISRLEPRKGVDQVIRAMPALRALLPRVVYMVGGGGADGPRLEALAESLGVADAVVFLGRVDESMKAALLSRADVFAMPTRREGNSVEGFGIAYVEAAWYGVPAIAGREGGAVDAVIDGQTGLIVNGADGDAVTRAIVSLLGDGGLRARLGGAAKARAHTELQWAETVKRYQQLMNGDGTAQ